MHWAGRLTMVIYICPTKLLGTAGQVLPESLVHWAGRLAVGPAHSLDQLRSIMAKTGIGIQDSSIQLSQRLLPGCNHWWDEPGFSIASQRSPRSKLMLQYTP